MNSNQKPVAKSLHTITVIMQVTRHVAATCAYTTDERRNNPTTANAMAEALIILGLNDRPDPYGLAAKSLKLLEGK